MKKRRKTQIEKQEEKRLFFKESPIDIFLCGQYRKMIRNPNGGIFYEKYICDISGKECKFYKSSWILDGVKKDPRMKCSTKVIIPSLLEAKIHG